MIEFCKKSCEEMDSKNKTKTKEKIQEKYTALHVPCALVKIKLQDTPIKLKP